MTEGQATMPDFSNLVFGAAAYEPSRDSAFAMEGYDGPPGLVCRDATALYKGLEFQAGGLNYFDGFIQLFETEDTESTRFVDDLNRMRRFNIPYIRINMSQFWPHLYKKYEEKKELYFYQMDRFVRAAEEVGIGLIACLFWNPQGLTDYCDEPLNEWGNPESRTRAFMEQYVREVVGRYRDSPAFWVWEFTNEFNLYCDLPNAMEAMPTTVNVAMGTRPSRDERDCMTTDIMVNSMKAFAAAVRRLDSCRMLTTGNTCSREAAYLCYTTGAYNRLDNREEFNSIMAIHNPVELDLFSIHMYDDEPRADETLAKIEGCVRECKQLSAGRGQAMMIGEYAGDITYFGEEQTREQFFRVFNAVRENRIPLSCVWSAWYNEAKAQDSVLSNPDLAYMLEALSAYNTAQFARLGQTIWK